jgi:starch synthase (maltosyl-transferring)
VQKLVLAATLTANYGIYGPPFELLHEARAGQPRSTSTTRSTELICYSKSSADRTQIILTVVSLDPHYKQSGFVELPLADLGLDPTHPYQVHDLLSDSRFLWHGPRNYVELDPAVAPAHVFRVRRRIPTERDFEAFS